MTRATKTRSRKADTAGLPSQNELDRLKISPEVAYYMLSRGIPLPDCPPLHKTPEPRDVPGARFDPDRVDKVIAVFHSLRHTKGRLAGRPLIPDPWQVAYILAPVFGWVRLDEDFRIYVRIIRTLYVELPRKNGKGLCTGTMILTRDGWKRFGSLEVGDMVHSIDGSLTRVSHVTPTRLLDCYRVTFQDGQQVVCDSDHLWTVWDRYGHDPEAWKATRSKGAWRTIETPELHATHRSGSRGDTRYSVRMDRVLDRPSAELPIDPYLLGLWLGDGHTDAARITTIDPEIVTAFSGQGWSIARLPGTVTYSIKGGFLVALRALGVLGSKHVPDAYLTASADQRMALLRGMMDTDGGVTRGPNTPRVEFTSTKKNLAESVLFLARSLGWKATIKESRATLNGKDCGPKWRVTWTAFRERSPFVLDRKTTRLHADPGRRTRSTTNTIVNVERVESVPTRCIQVEHESHQFLVGDGLIPTHNSTLAGGIGIYLTTADGEEGAQVIAAATRLEQAQFVFAPIKQLAEKAPALAKHCSTFKAKIVHRRTGSYFQPVANAGDAQHGADLHGGIIDELHLHKDNDLVEAIETGTGSRTQPLIVFITTADASRKETPYDRKRTLVEQLARGVLKDPATYGIVFGADSKVEGFDPYSEATQRAANPGYGVSPTRAYLKQAAVKAQQSPADHASYLRLHLNIRTKQSEKFLDIDAWDRNASIVDESKLRGRRAYGGLDLASVSDLNALCWCFPDAERGGFDLIWRLWTPEDNIPALDKRTAGAASVWVKQGILTATPGNVSDYDYILEAIKADSVAFDVAEIAYDRWNSSQLVNDLTAEGAPMVQMGQSFASMSAPTKQTQRLMLQGTEDVPILRHGGNPAVRWTVDNFAAAIDAQGNVKPDKANSGDKIDPVTALIMALSRAIEATPPIRSAYEDDGLMVI